MKRFTRTQGGGRSFGTAALAALLCFCAIVLLMVYGMNRINRGNTQRQEKALKRAVKWDITLCYAWEGRYPPSAAYLSAHYGLTYDRRAFTVKVQPRGVNLRPDVAVIRKDGAGG